MVNPQIEGVTILVAIVIVVLVRLCDGIFLWSQCVVRQIWYNGQVRCDQEAFVL